jgi:hypothetical protein
MIENKRAFIARINAAILRLLDYLVKMAFSLIWWKYLHDYHTGRQSKVIKVRGWRSALIDTPSGQRMSVYFCPFNMN